MSQYCQCRKNQHDQNRCLAIQATRSPLLAVCLSTLSMPLVPLGSTGIRGTTAKDATEIRPSEDEKLLKEMLTSITEKFHAAEETHKSFQHFIETDEVPFVACWIYMD